MYKISSRLTLLRQVCFSQIQRQSSIIAIFLILYKNFKTKLNECAQAPLHVYINTSHYSYDQPACLFQLIILVPCLLLSADKNQMTAIKELVTY